MVVLNEVGNASPTPSPHPVQELSSKNPSPVGKVCDIHTAPQEKIAQLTLTALCHACHGG